MYHNKYGNENGNDMKYTFKLKEPNKEGKTLILFCSEFKLENKRFVYSTGETIHPKNWDPKTKFPIAKGKSKPIDFETLKTQLNRYSDLFIENVGLYKRINEELTSEVLRGLFNDEFKITKKGKNIFFDTYDLFMSDRQKNKIWAPATVKRYDNIRNILVKFEKAKKYKLTFSRINDKFHSEFTSYCMDDLKHINNTYARNLGLFKTFMFWAKKERHTYNDAFIGFEKVKRVITNQIALTIEDLDKLLSHEFKSKKLERVRDVFVFQCVTGMRFGELSQLSKSNVTENYILLKEEKDKNKEVREIPLTSISRFLLLKYDYKLPLIANQKHNEYIKEVFEELEYTHKVQRITTKGKENIIEEFEFYDRISSHTARRTFITMMKAEGKSDKLIASITGHTDMKTLNQYYQVSEPEKKKAMDEVFKLSIPLKKIQ